MLFRREARQEPSNHGFLKQIKEETSLIGQWLHYFYRKNDEHDIRIRLLEQHAHKTKKTDEQRAHKLTVLEQQFAMLNAELAHNQRRTNIILEAQEPLLKKIEEVEKKLAGVGQQHSPLYESLKELHQRLSLLEKSGRKALASTSTPKERLAKKVAKKSKEYVKHTIQSLVEKYGRIEGLQLRDIVVEEQKLCSKSTFYRLLGDLEEDSLIGSVRQAKEKTYVSQLEKPVLQ